MNGGIYLEIPKHIAIIMDGNGRWAKKHFLPRSVGHTAGAKAIKPIVLHCNKLGVSVLTLFAFSTENWSRPKSEIKNILFLINQYISKIDDFIKFNVRVKFIGDISVFDESMQQKFKEVEQKFSENTGLILIIAINYGGRDEIKNAVKKIAVKIKKNELDVDEISSGLIEQNLYTSGLPNIDLLIRTGGEFRISNFLLWQIAYAELLFLDEVLWPDFKKEHIDFAIEEYNRRNRTYGNVVDL